MRGGWIRIERGVFDHPLFDDDRFSKREAWLWLIAEAAHTECQARAGKTVITLARGQVSYSLRFLARKWGWSVGKVRRFVDALVADTAIDTATEHGQIQITICNYDKYQSVRNSGGTAAEQQQTQGRNSDGHKEESIEEIKYISPSLRSGDCRSPVENPPSEPDEVSQALHAYNAAATKQGWPKAAKLTAARKAKIKARLRDAGGLEGWSAALERAGNSSFCNGGNDRGWRAHLDFLLQESSFARLMEGAYDDRCPPPRQGAPPGPVSMADYTGRVLEEWRQGRVEQGDDDDSGDDEGGRPKAGSGWP